MPGTSDAWANLDARALVLDLADRGIDLTVEGGRLRVAPAAALTHADEVALRRHKADVMVITLICDERTLDRLLAFRKNTLGRERHPSGCSVCGGHLPGDRVSGRCGWCALASRLYAGGPVPRDVLSLFDSSIRGPRVGLPFDLAVPA